MKILLIYPYCLEERVNTEDAGVIPIGLYYIAAVLKQNNYDVEILNWSKMKAEPRKIKDILISKKPDIIGFSILQANRWGAIDIARMARQIDPKTKIVFGGVSATFMWKHFLTHFSEIDFVIRGEGEFVFLNLVKSIEDGSYKPRDIKGLAFRKKGRPVKTEDFEFIRDIDSLPNPAKYFKYNHLALSRGCPGHCTFCGSPQFWRRKVRFHSTHYFVKELELLYQKGVTFFYISDDTFTLKKNLVIGVCKKILEKRLQIRWYAISRVDYIDEEIICWMKKAGCIQISFGVESGSEKIRNLLGKTIKTDQIKRAFDLTTKYGILARAYFIYGCPGETWETIQETIDLIYEIKPLSIVFYVLVLFPGTALYAQFEKKIKLGDNIWLNRIEDIIYYETDPQLSQELILDFGKKLRSNFYDHLPDFVDAIHLIDKKEFYSTHSDFCSRLGMTFDHGDYSRIKAIKNKDKVSEKLYIRALNYSPDPRAYLGLGIMHQKKKAYKESISRLTQGVNYFPDNEQLNLCLGISHMNLGEYNKALSYLLKFKDLKQFIPFIVNCYQALRDF